MNDLINSEDKKALKNVSYALLQLFDNIETYVYDVSPKDMHAAFHIQMLLDSARRDIEAALYLSRIHS